MRLFLISGDWIQLLLKPSKDLLRTNNSPQRHVTILKTFLDSYPYHQGKIDEKEKHKTFHDERQIVSEALSSYLVNMLVYRSIGCKRIFAFINTSLIDLQFHGK